MILEAEYGDKFQRMSLSIISEGITAVGGDGFVDNVDISGTAYFTEGEGPSPVFMMDIIDDAFSSMNQIFLETLSESPDAFLSQIASVEVSVERPSSNEGNAMDNDDNGDDDSLKMWVIAVAVASTAVCSLFLFCCICICCLGDPDEDDEHDLKQTDTDELPTSRGSKSDDEDDHGIVENNTLSDENMGDLQVSTTNLDDNSIFSQDSSKFTYNPKSIVSAGDHTFQTYETDVEGTWRQGRASNLAGTGIELPFGNDISAINGGVGMSRIDVADGDSLLLSESEVDTISPTGTLGTYGDMSGMTDMFSPEELRARRVPSSIRNKPVATATHNALLDDLDDLGKRMQAYRASNRFSPKTDKL